MSSSEINQVLANSLSPGEPPPPPLSLTLTYFCGACVPPANVCGLAFTGCEGQDGFLSR